MEVRCQQFSNELKSRFAVPVNLKCEYCENPIGISVSAPRFSWKIEADYPNFKQKSYQILVASTEADIRNDVGDLWNTGVVNAAIQNGIIYDGAKLVVKAQYWWKVRIWDTDDNESGWSEVCSFETGMFAMKDWDAFWISGEGDLGLGAVYYERKEFSICNTKTVERARAYVGSSGGRANSYELRANGKKVGNDIIRPGQTNTARPMYRAYDVTNEMKSGKNAVGILHTRDVIFQLEIYFRDGTQESICSGNGWLQLKKGAFTELRYGLKGLGEGKGETYDARLHPEGWDAAGYDDSHWTLINSPFTKTSGPRHMAAQLQSIECFDSFSPISIRRISESRQIIDFGQNLHGIIRLSAQGSAGSKISVRYSEKLTEDGFLDCEGTEAQWLANCQPQYDEFILCGKGIESFELKFSSHGFRFAEVEGPCIDIKEGDITALMVHSDILNGSKFECSSPMLNALQHCAEWSFRSNLVSVPTDCPARERAGWTGDAHCHAEADCLNFDMVLFFEKWFSDIRQVQERDGSIHYIIPDDSGGGMHQDVPWNAAVVMIPWIHYMTYGDKKILVDNYELMRGWLGCVETYRDKNHLLQDATLFGDWVASDNRTSHVFLASAYYYRSLGLMAKIASVIGNPGDQELYFSEAEKVKAGINSVFLKGQGYYDLNTQTANALALAFEIVPEESKEHVVRNLLEGIRNAGGLTTGALGTEVVMKVLSDFGHDDVAYSLADSSNKLTWGYWVSEFDATTSFELFGTKIASNNHPFLIGGLSAWFYGSLAGIRIVKPGFEEFVINPYVHERLESVFAQINTVRGFVRSSWEKREGGFVMNISVPANSTARVHVPVSGKVTAVSLIMDKTSLPFEACGDKLVYNIGSGEYRFEVS